MMIFQKILFQVLILVLLLLNSCSYENSKQGDFLVGKWKSSELSIGRIYGYIKVPYNDGDTITPGYISSDFLLSFKEDLNIMVEKDGGKSNLCQYRYSKDSIKIILNNLDWLKFGIEEQTDSVLKVSMHNAMFYDIENDSIAFISGYNVKLKLEKIDNR